MHAALRTMGLLAAWGACGDDGRAVQGDAGVDAVRVCNEELFYIDQPIAGTVPAGPLEGFRYMVGMRNDGFCGGTYQIVFARRPHHCAEDDASFTLWVRHPAYGEPVPVAGQSLEASASYQDPYGRDDDFDGAQFVVGVIDSPHVVGEGARVAGTFSAHMDGWDFEIAVDTVAQSVGVCL